MVGTSGERWKAIRLLTMKYMKALGYGSSKMEDIIMTQVEDILDEMKNLADKRTPTFVQPMLMKAAYKIISDLAVGQVFTLDDPNLPIFLGKVRTLFATFNNPFSFFPYLRYLPGDIFGLKKITDTIDDLVGICRGLVEHRKREIMSGDGLSDEPHDIIGMYYYDMAKMKREKGTSEKIISGIYYQSINTSGNTCIHLIVKLLLMCFSLSLIFLLFNENPFMMML